MTIDINQFWNLVAGSQLLEPAKFQSLFSQYAAEFNRSINFGDGTPDSDATSNSNSNQIGTKAEDVAKWLINQNAISPYQAKILLAGETGPFNYGNYTILRRIKEGPLAGNFIGKHRSSEHQVLLQFLPGKETADLATWKKIEDVSSALATIKHPNLLPLHEAVALQNFRFVASEPSSGKAMAQAVPRKGRLPWKDACKVLGSVARALGQMHKAGLPHGDISPRTIWLESGGVGRLQVLAQPDPNFAQPNPESKESESKLDYAAPETLGENPAPHNEQSDIYSLGCTLYRVLMGQTVFAEVGDDAESKIEAHKSVKPLMLDKAELPPELEKLIFKMLAKSPGQRPEDVGKVGRQLLDFAETTPKEVAAQVKRPPTLVAYQRELQKWNPGAAKLIETPIPVQPIEADTTAPTSMVSSRERIAKAAESAERRKKSGWQIPATIAAVLLVLSGVGGLVAMRLSSKPIVRMEPEVIDEIDPLVIDPEMPKNPDKVTPENTEQQTETLPGLVQTLIDDDGASLWETPTTGKPIAFNHLPQNPRLIFAFRPAEIMADPEGMNLMKSLGPRFVSLVNSWKQQTGLELDQVEQVVVALYSTAEFTYRPFYFVRLAQPTTESNLLQRWQNPKIKNLPSNANIKDTTAPRAYSRGGDSFYIPAGQKNEVEAFAFGTTEQVDEVHESGGFVPLAGPIGRLAERTDRERHFNFLFLRNSLFNDEGQDLMTNLPGLNKSMNRVIDDEIRGMLVSLHLDEGTYLEMALDHDRNIKADDLKERVTARLPDLILELTQFTATNSANDYWKNVHIRYAGMLSDLFRNTRTKVEGPYVMSNCWLPPVAAHNLIATSEMLIAFAGTDTDATAPVASTAPKSIEELLQTKRTLENATDPDLGILLTEIQEEIRSDYANLPFEFNIRLMGTELGKEGITQNQRPGSFKFENESVGSILTQIMVMANSDKTITGPSDPKCKLIWVIADDPKSPGQKAVLVTTRAHATASNFELPEAFKPE